MSEYNYRYAEDDEEIDLNNDDMYDYVLERESLKELNNVGPKCMRDFGGEFAEEHFGNMHFNKKITKHKIFMILIVIAILVALYYVMQCDAEPTQFITKPGNYVARFSN